MGGVLTLGGCTEEQLEAGVARKHLLWLTHIVPQHLEHWSHLSRFANAILKTRWEVFVCFLSLLGDHRKWDQIPSLTISAAADRSRLCSLPASSSRRRACSSCFSLNWDSWSNIKSSTLSRVSADCSTVLLGSVVEAFTLFSASREIWKYLVILSKAPRARSEIAYNYSPRSWFLTNQGPYLVSCGPELYYKALRFKKKKFRSRNSL